MLIHFLTMGLPTDATDEQIREKYLELVREHTPENSPVEFRRINEAYEAIKSNRKRIAGHLFGQYMPGNEEQALRSMADTRKVERRRVGLKELFETEKRTGR